MKSDFSDLTEQRPKNAVECSRPLPSYTNLFPLHLEAFNMWAVLIYLNALIYTAIVVPFRVLVAIGICLWPSKKPQILSLRT